MRHLTLTAMMLALAVPAYAQAPQPSQGQPDQPAQAPATPPAAQTEKPATPPAEQAQKPATPSPSTSAAADRFIQSQEENQILASRLIGRSVNNAAGQDIGDVNDILVGQDGNLEAIVVGVGGFLGLGEKRVAVNYDFVKESGGFSGDRLVMGMTEDELRSAPDFKPLEDKGEEVAQRAPDAGSGTGTTRTQ